jgi:hypothetical protein
MPRRRTLRGWGAFLVLIVIAALATGAVVSAKILPGEQERTLSGPAGEPFRIEHPETWLPFSAEELQALPAPPLAVLRREDGKGIIVVRREKPFAGKLSGFARDLRRELGRRLPDFKAMSARLVLVKAGNAFFYSYVRERRGTVHTIVIVPAGSRSYVLNSVSHPGANHAAREIGEIISSFSLKG